MATDLVGGFALDGRVALITGGGGGFGRVCALLLAEHGASVIVADVNEARNSETVELIREARGSAVAVTTDVSSEADVRRAIRVAVESFGGLDILINNAGIGLTGLEIENTSVDDWDRVLNVNLRGAFLGCKHALPVMRDRGGGSIINVSSGASLVAYPGIPVYTASKGGLNAMTRALALDFGRHNIRVNAICPSGGMSANMMLPPDSPQVDESSLWRDWDPSTFYAPLWRPQPPLMIDHARVVLFLASPASGYLTGLNLPSDGGMSIKASVDVERLLANWASVDAGGE